MYLPYFTTQRHEWDGPLLYNPILGIGSLLHDPVSSPSSFSPKGKLVSLVKYTSENVFAHNTDSGRIWTSGLGSLNNLSVDRCSRMITTLKQEPQLTAAETHCKCNTVSVGLVAANSPSSEMKQSTIIFWYSFTRKTSSQHPNTITIILSSKWVSSMSWPNTPPWFWLTSLPHPLHISRVFSESNLASTVPFALVAAYVFSPKSVHQSPHWFKPNAEWQLWVCWGSRVVISEQFGLLTMPWARRRSCHFELPSPVLHGCRSYSQEMTLKALLRQEMLLQLLNA